jgi:hypothetical protein
MIHHHLNGSFAFVKKISFRKTIKADTIQLLKAYYITIYKSNVYLFIDKELSPQSLLPLPT